METRVGILGGIGPESTSMIYTEIMRKLQDRGIVSDNTDYPHVIINSIPAPELVHNEISPKDLELYRKGIIELNEFGVNFVLMACNTIHLFFDEMQNASEVPIIDIRQEVREAIRKSGAKRVLVIGTPNTVKKGLYRFEEIEHVTTNNEELSVLSSAIHNFTNGIDKSGNSELVGKICRKYLGVKADVVLLACTEISAMLKDEKIQKIDTIEVMAESVIRLLTSPLEMKRSSVHGFGMFSKSSISKDDEFYRIPTSVTIKLPEPMAARISDGVYVRDNTVLDWINHSCRPNAEIRNVKDGPVLAALRDTGKGEEITIDYNKTEEHNRKIKCNCKSGGCLGFFFSG